MMKASTVGVVLAVVSSALLVPLPPTAAQPTARACDPLGRIQFLCDVVSPEDFALVPGTEWIMTSGNRAGQGAIRALNARDRKISTVFPSSTTTRPDTRAYPTCPGPLDLAVPAEQSRFAVHGMYLKPGRKNIHTLYVVHHGARESIEVFELDGASRPPSVTWVGCVVAPENGVFNAVVGLPEGGVAATNIPRTGVTQPGTPGTSADAASAGSGRGGAGSNPIGAVWEWHASTGWQAVPGSETARINGLEVSKDGKWFYIAGWGDQTFIRLERGARPVRKDVLPMPFRIDNVRLMDNGTILAAGHGGTALCSCPTETWHVGRIDPRALKVQELLRQPYVEGFGAATVAVQVGREIWIGTNRGDRVGYFPAP